MWNLQTQMQRIRRSEEVGGIIEEDEEAQTSSYTIIRLYGRHAQRRRPLHNIVLTLCDDRWQ